ncbi:hypothetical protein CLOM_g6330 [Closterium sp. NIES-68]|nr:hypothetical protein CLOM_g6330 [Closterium sp. NIES-68]
MHTGRGGSRVDGRRAALQQMGSVLRGRVWARGLASQGHVASSEDCSRAAEQQTASSSGSSRSGDHSSSSGSSGAGGLEGRLG